MEFKNKPLKMFCHVKYKAIKKLYSWNQKIEMSEATFSL